MATYVKVNEYLLQQRLLESLKEVARELEDNPTKVAGWLPADIQLWVAQQVTERTLKHFRP